VTASAAGFLSRRSALRIAGAGVTVIAALWLWWQGATVATAYLLGDNERFQQLVILVISELGASGSVTLLLLGSLYALAGLLQLLCWPGLPLQRRLGPSAIVLWAVIAAAEYALHVAGLAPYAQALVAPISSAEPLLIGFRLIVAPITALGPELLLVAAVRLLRGQPAAAPQH
jgi:hypothetical protein